MSVHTSADKEELATLMHALVISFHKALCACSFCNDCRDLDLCRDDELARHRWNCRTCEQPYNQANLEQRLVMALQHRVREYQLQDLKCVRCKQVRGAPIQYPPRT